jgi:AcrR family transcriptional regulator
MTRLSTERLDELYQGTLALVMEHGFDRITMDQIAEATKSSKATLYRQWGSKSALVVEAIRCATVEDTPLPDTGSLRGDLLSVLGDRSRAIDGDGELVGSMLHAVKADRAMRKAVREQIVSALRARIDTMTTRAVSRGEISPDNPALAFVDLVLIAPFVLRTLIDDVPPDDDYLTRYLDAVLLPALGVS